MREKVVIFGAGHYGRAVLRKCKENKKFKPICFLDSNWKKNNTYALKKKIYHISKINRIDFDKIIFSGHYIKQQLKQVKKYKVGKKKFLIWKKSKVFPLRKKLIQREKILLKMLTYVINKFNQNQISYWADFSGLLALKRKQNLAEMSDFDIAINFYDIKKVYKILKINKKIYSFPNFFYKIPNYPEFISSLKKKQKVEKTRMFMIGNVNPLIIEPPMIDFVFKKITQKKAINIQTKGTSPLKHWKYFDLLKYKGLVLRIPKYSTQYLEYLYGAFWRKKAQFWEISNKR